MFQVATVTVKHSTCSDVMHVIVPISSLKHFRIILETIYLYTSGKMPRILSNIEKKKVEKANFLPKNST